MEHLTHTMVVDWLVHLSKAAPGLLSPSGIYPHLATCRQCQEHLSLLAITSFAIVPPIHLQSKCLDFEAIAAFIDAEADYGTTHAFTNHATVWWHLSRCQACAELYTQTVADLAFAQSADFASKPMIIEPQVPMFYTPLFSQQYQKLWPELNISVGQLSSLVQYQQARFRAAEADQEPSVINEASGPALTIEATLALHDETWLIMVKVDPPIVGRAVAVIGDQYFYATFEQGIATFADFQAAIFQADPSISMRLFAEEALE